MDVLRVEKKQFEYTAPILIIGAGACGLTAALAAADAGVEAIVIERDKVPLGSTGLSTGLIPASGTKLQAAAGVSDDVASFIEDILHKTNGETDHALVEQMAGKSAEIIDWLCDKHGLELELCVGLRYPGHSCDRMHGTRNRTGVELEAQLLAAAERAGVFIMTSAEVRDIYVTPDKRIAGVRIARPDASVEELGCQALVAACCGFGANPAMIKQFIPSLSGAPYLGHEGNKGHAIMWGMALDAAIADMGAFQGHGAIGNPSGVPMWNTITINGIQVNLDGYRFSDESCGYSEQALKVLAQRDGLVWNIFDQRGHDLASTYVDYREGFQRGAVKIGQNAAELSTMIGVPEKALTDTLAEVDAMFRGERACPFGRDFTKSPPLQEPFYAARVTGAFLHTQGGLVVSPEDARVLDKSGGKFPNFFAGGGAARGISGNSDFGYLAGNGLLTAVVLGAIAGKAASQMI